MKVKCAECGQRNGNVRLREKTDRNFHVDRRPLCTPCARKHGWVDVSFDRGYHGSLGAVT